MGANAVEKLREWGENFVRRRLSCRSGLLVKCDFLGLRLDFNRGNLLCRGAVLLQRLDLTRIRRFDFLSLANEFLRPAHVHTRTNMLTGGLRRATAQGAQALV